MSTPTPHQLIPSSSSSQSDPSNPNPTSLYSQQILEEDDYIEGLSYLIKRDFFPDLLEFGHGGEREREQELQHEGQEERRRMEEMVRERMQMGIGIGGRTDISKRSEFTPGRTPFALPSNTPRPGAATPYGVAPGAATPNLASFSSERSEPPTPTAAAGALAGPSSSVITPLPPSCPPNISIDAYQARYTSSDNASFSTILNSHNVDRKRKYAWAFEAERKANEREEGKRDNRERTIEMVERMRIMAGSSGDGDGEVEVRMIEGSSGRPGDRKFVVGRKGNDGRFLAIEGAEKSVGKGKGPLMIEGPKDDKGKGKQTGTSDSEARGDSENGEEKNGVVDLNPDVTEDILDGIVMDLKENDQTMVETWPFKTRNQLMFLPDADTSPYPSDRPSSSSEAKKDSLNPYMEPKSIAHDNTRFPSMYGSLSNGDDPASPTRSNIEAAIKGTPHPSRDLMTPRVSGFSFVEDMPSPTESTAEQLLTWGTIESTPVALRSSDDSTPSGPFRIRETGRREVLAHKMASKARKNLSQKDIKNKNNKSSSGIGLRKQVLLSNTMAGGDATTPKREEMLSPAARNLLNKTGGGGATTPKSGNGGNDNVKRVGGGGTTPRGWGELKSGSTPSGLGGVWDFSPRTPKPVVTGGKRGKDDVVEAQGKAKKVKT